jgi:phenylacetate-coenzyme A ligase PaaK-like adenylate-forming protein
MYFPVGISAGWLNQLSSIKKMDLKKRIFNINDQREFLETATEVFKYQYYNNKVYREFVDNLGKNQNSVTSLEDIPFLPVEFFRNHKIVTGDSPVQMVFESSGTTGFVPGKHYITDPDLYEESFLNAFRLFYGDPADYLILALLPSYTERKGSSLVFMVEKLVEKSNFPESGFYKDDPENLLKAVKIGKDQDIKTILIGVSFALLDLAENQSPDLSRIIVMETGGMKGRRKEIIRHELHSILKDKFNIHSVHSEYGMTELLSQAYSSGNGIFFCPPWMKILIRDPQDPLSIFAEPGKTGGINIIDLANINSCSFIATRDLGKLYPDGGFEVLGRFDNSDIRGCNLLAE